MALTRIDFDINGEVQFSRALELAEHEARDMSGALNDIADQLLASIGDQFRSEGARSGETWQPLSTRYAQWKESNFPGMPMLVRSRTMRGAMLDRRRAVKVTPNLMVYEVPADPEPGGDMDASRLAAIHHAGEGRMPARRLVSLTPQDRIGWNRALVNWVNGLRHKSGLGM